jgi:hypothetical protein
MEKNMNYKIAYFIHTDIQHLPPVIRLLPHLGGILITTKKTIFELFKKKYNDFDYPIYVIKRKKEARKIILENRIRVVIYPGYNSFGLGKSVEIFHGGLSDKNYVESLNILLYNLVLFPGEKTKDKVEKSGYLKYIQNWEIIGYPKFDALINNKIEEKKLFNNSKKTILYAPTWISNQKITSIIKFSEHGESSLIIWGKEIVKALHKDYNLIIKYHSKIVKEKGDIFDQIDELVDSLNANESVKTIFDDNILPYMYQADLMISDISTACYEWFHFDRPIIYANPSPEHYRPSNDIGSNTYAWQAGDVINNNEDIRKFVASNLNEDKYQLKRNTIFNYTVFQPDGNATIRQAKAIIEFYNKYAGKPYYPFIIGTFIWSKTRKQLIKLINAYYHLFKKEKIGK